MKEPRGGKGESAIGKPVDRWKVWKVNRERSTRHFTRMKYVCIYGANYENEILTRHSSRYYPLFYLQIILRCCVTSLSLDYFWFNLNNYFIKSFFKCIYLFYDLRMYYFGDLTISLTSFFFKILRFLQSSSLIKYTFHVAFCYSIFNHFLKDNIILFYRANQLDTN